jgi:uncharacterized damage-inducible protein DinB
MTWTSPDISFSGGAETGPERPILEGMLQFQRETLLHVCAGLTADQLAERPVPPANLSLLGLVRHMTKVERIWFGERARGEVLPPLFDPELGRDADFEDIRPEDAEDAVTRLQDAWTASDLAAAGLDLDHLVPTRDEPISLRMVYVHMIGEYARHNGHADLLRQSIDGVTGR